MEATQNHFHLVGISWIVWNFGNLENWDIMPCSTIFFFIAGSTFSPLYWKFNIRIIFPGSQTTSEASPEWVSIFSDLVCLRCEMKSRLTRMNKCPYEYRKEVPKILNFRCWEEMCFISTPFHLTHLLYNCSIGHNPEHIVDVDWRLDYHIKVRV